MAKPEPPTQAEIDAELAERVRVDATLEGRIARAVYEDALRRSGTSDKTIKGKWAGLNTTLRGQWLSGAAVALDVILGDDA